MHIASYITTDYHRVTLTDRIDTVLLTMGQLEVKQLTVVEEDFFYGLITEDQLLDEANPNQTIVKLKHQLISIHLFEDQHIYDALQMMADQDLSMLPVLDRHQHYLGYITKQDILIALNTIIGTQDAAIIILELQARDNALSHISRIIESENAYIYNTALHPVGDSGVLELTIKLDRANLSAVISSLQRHDYRIKATFRDSIDSSKLQDRYQLLMNYLDM